MEGAKESGMYLLDIEGKERILLTTVTLPRKIEDKLLRGHSRLGQRNLLQLNEYIKNDLIKHGFSK